MSSALLQYNLPKILYFFPRPNKLVGFTALIMSGSAKLPRVKVRFHVAAFCLDRGRGVSFAVELSAKYEKPNVLPHHIKDCLKRADL